jgi:hypothetical protein
MNQLPTVEHGLTRRSISYHADNQTDGYGYIIIALTSYSVSIKPN